MQKTSSEFRQPSQLSNATVLFWTSLLVVMAFAATMFFVSVVLTIGPTVAQEPSAPAKKKTQDVESDDGSGVLVSLGINANRGLIESSGVGICSFVENSIWTHNDSGHSTHLFLLRTDGVLLAKVQLSNAKNVDWEAMCRFKIEGKPYLMVGDVGDNLARRRSGQLYLLPEPDLSAKLDLNKGKESKPLVFSTKATRFEFTYPDGPRNCEAIAVDVLGRQIWLIEKIYFDKHGKKSPGIYVLPLNLKPLDKPMVAKRIADFPPSNVTGMDFSPDGQRLIIRNYLNAHLYTRLAEETWESVVKQIIPGVVVLPLQRQGESVCFTEDSKSIVLTSELNRQPIWQVNLESNFEQPRRKKKTKDQKN